MKTWYQIQAKKDKPKAAEVSIHDEIGLWGIRAADFMRDLKALGEVDEIRMSIHSPGGDVLDGWAIYNALKQSKARVTARVEGLAASMASVILMAADEVEIPENAYVMIHNPWGLAIGDADEMRETADLLDKLESGLVRAYAGKTKRDEDEIREWMDAETWMDGREAVERGFADKLLDGVAMSARAFDTRRFKMTPSSLQASVDPTPPVAPADEPQAAPVEPQAPVDAPADPAPVEPQAPAEPTEPEPQASLLDRLKKLVGLVPPGEPGELQAKIEAKDAEIKAMQSRLSELETKAKAHDEAMATIAQLEAERQTAEAKAAQIVAATGFTPESEQSLPNADADKGDILTQFEAITDPAERTRFYKAHKKAILAARNK